MRTRAKSLFVSVLAVFMCVNIACAQDDDESLSAPMIIEKDVVVETRAGDRVLVNIYRPNKPGKFPVLVSMGPYGKDKLPAEYDGAFADGQIYVSEHAAFETADPAYWNHYDYVVIAADSPGSNGSEGDLDIFGPIEANAYYDVIEWAAAQGWSNGNVGLNGVSYFAMSQWYVAALHPPSLKAIMPSEGLTDFYRDVIRHGGVPAIFAKPWMEHRIRRVKNPDAELINDLAATGDEHPLYDDRWRGLDPELEKIVVPAYVIASWPDHGLHTRGTLIGFERISSQQKWLDIHGRKKWEYWYSRESVERQRRFYDHFLKGTDNGFEDTPTVRYERRSAFYDGDDQHAASWPLENTENTRLYLRQNGALSQDSAADATVLQYESTGPDSQLVFRYEFTEPTEITGGAKLKLWVEIEDGDNMDIFVGLAKLDRNNEEVFMSGYNDVENGHLASGWLRVSHRELDAERSTDLRPFLKHEAEQELTPGQKVPVEIEILPSSTFFDTGESLALRIKGTELDAAGDIAHEDPVNVGTHSVHVGGGSDSYLLVPVVPR